MSYDLQALYEEGKTVMMKRLFCLFIALLILMTGACSKSDASSEDKAPDEGPW